LAAIIYEPVLQAAGGMRLYSPALLSHLRSWATAHGVYLIADEIAAGMGRLGAMLASHLAAEALPDIAVLSKGLTGGFLPLSAVLTTDTVYDLFDADYHEGKAFLHSNTYTGNALGVAVALAALDVYATEGVLDLVAARGDQLRRSMAVVVARCPHLRRLRSAGLMAAVDLTTASGEPIDPNQRTGTRIAREAIRRGVLLRPLGDTLYIFPPLITPAADLQTMVRTLAASVEAVLGE
jgi:adenosylmethionine-8-amino-7-oxononanoate aminotransferase